MPLVTLLTDFGLDDSYVGEMKAAILRGAPGATLVDITHGIPPGRVREAAWVLRNCWDQFPEGTCHVAVVDPGVGGQRRALAASAGGHFFVGPDNGILLAAIDRGGTAPEIREITVREIDRPRRGTTFDGRDLFAPVAAKLVSGLPMHQVGPEIGPVRGDPFAPVREAGGWSAEIVHVDRFGNLVTVAEEALLREEFGEDWREISVGIGSDVLQGVRFAYEEVPEGEGVLTIGSAGTLEVGVRLGSARDRFGEKAGGAIRIMLPPHG